MVEKGIAAACALACVLLAGSVDAADASTSDFTRLDLTGDWYVLVHYKDDRSEDESIVKFKDFAWSIEQTANTLTWEEYPYVLFRAELELQRRHAMINHIAWAPDDAVVLKLREKGVDVSSRAMKRKRMKGSVGQGFESLAPLVSGGLNTMTFSRTWKVEFEEERIRIEIIDALSGGAGLGSMEGATVLQILERAGPNELRGKYDEETRHGTIRLIRAAKRNVIK